MRKLIFAAPLVLGLASLCPISSFAQSESATTAIASSNSLPETPPVRKGTTATPPLKPIGGKDSVLSRIGIGLRVSTLGPGAEVAYEVTRHINVGGGFNFFSLSENFTNGGVSYGGTVKLQSGDAHLDYFLWHSLHVSPGILFSNRSLLSATLGVPGGNTFSLSGTTYTSDSANPLAGRGALNFNNTVAPSILFGVGNLVPRDNHHFSVKFDVGGAYRGSPNVKLNFTGSVCDQNGANCQSAASYATFQNSVLAQQSKFNKDISALKFYPIIRLEFGFKL